MILYPGHLYNRMGRVFMRKVLKLCSTRISLFSCNEVAGDPVVWCWKSGERTLGWKDIHKSACNSRDRGHLGFEPLVGDFPSIPAPLHPPVSPYFRGRFHCTLNSTSSAPALPLPSTVASWKMVRRRESGDWCQQSTLPDPSGARHRWRSLVLIDRHRPAGFVAKRSEP